MDKLKLERNLRICQLMEVFYAGICLMIPSIVGYWTAHGMKFQDIALLQSCFAIGVVVLEVPSGYFADCFGRKRSMVIASCLLAIGDVVYATSSGFYGFLLAELLLAASFAFCSGADVAMARSSLRALGRESEFDKFVANLHCLAFISMAVAGTLGGFLASINPTLPFWGEALLGMFAIISTLHLVEPEGAIESNRKMSLREVLQMAKRSFAVDFNIAWLILFSALLSSWIRISVWLYQPYFEKSGLSLTEIGFAFSALNLMAAVGSRYLGRHLAGGSVSWVKLLLVTAAAYISMSFCMGLAYAWTLPLFHQVIRGAMGVGFASMLRKRVAEQDFATVGSMQSFSSSLVYACVLPLFCASIDCSGAEFSLLLAGIIGLSVCMLAYCYKPAESIEVQ